MSEGHQNATENQAIEGHKEADVATEDDVGKAAHDGTVVPGLVGTEEERGERVVHVDVWGGDWGEGKTGERLAMTSTSGVRRPNLVCRCPFCLKWYKRCARHQRCTSSMAKFKSGSEKSWVIHGECLR